MNRRGFLGAIAAALGGAVLDPDKLLWVPGAKLISIPRPRLRGNTILDERALCEMWMKAMKDSLEFPRLVNREYSKAFVEAVFPIGETINVRKPLRLMGVQKPMTSWDKTLDVRCRDTVT